MGKTRTKPAEGKDKAATKVAALPAKLIAATKAEGAVTKVSSPSGVTGSTPAKPTAAAAPAKAPKRTALASGCFYITSSFNNTLVTFTDHQGNVIAQSSAGKAGFRNTKKGTPYAGAKAMELLVDKASQYDIREARVIIRGIGPGRESAIRALFNANVNIVTIEDRTPVAFGGPKRRRPRRV